MLNPSNKILIMNENLLLVPALDVEKWPNDLHIQFNQTQDECLCEAEIQQIVTNRTDI